MERITRTLKLLEIETPKGERRFIAPCDIDVMQGCKVLGRKDVVAVMPLSVFVEYAELKEVK